MKSFCFLTLLMFTHCLLAQVSLQGNLVDNQTGKGIAYAQLRTASGWGTISNSEGRFILNIPEHSQIQITHLAYEEISINSKEISIQDTALIQLSPRPLELEAVVITPVDPVELLQDAIKAIPDNHSHDPVMSQAFYREFLQVGDSGVSLNEAVVELYQMGNGIESHQNSQAHLLKGRSSEAQLPIDRVQLMFGGGGITSASGIPVIGKPKAEPFIGNKVFKNYDYSLQEVISHNGRDTYVIVFDQKRKLRKRLYQGKIYLDTKTLAFVHIDYQTSEKGKKFRFGQIAGFGGSAIKAALRIAGIKIQLLNDQGQQQFSYHKGHWYLNSVNNYFEAEFDIKKDGQREIIPFIVTRDFVVTHFDHQGSAAPIPEERRIDPETALVKQVGMYDEGFWESYNYIPASTPLYEQVSGWHGAETEAEDRP